MHDAREHDGKRATVDGIDEPDDVGDEDDEECRRRKVGDLSCLQNLKDLRIQGDAGNDTIRFREQIDWMIVSLDPKASADSV